MVITAVLIYSSDLVVQIVPHITNAIQDWIERVSKIPVDETGEEPDICIVEVRESAIPLVRESNF